MTWLGIIATVVAFIAFLIWWLFFETEGVYLGKGVVIWLYDVYATRYDAIVQNEAEDEHLYIAAPLMSRILPHNNPLVLDVATGTGRLPLALCHHPSFEGRIIACDLSRKMMAEAERKIGEEHFGDYVTFVWANGQTLPYQDISFDVVTCMEALEFFPDPIAALSELSRVLREGGLLLTTQRVREYWMPRRTWTEEQMQQHLENAGFIAVEFEVWQYDYTKVWARKHGSSDFIGV